MYHDIIYPDGTGSERLAFLRACEEVKVAWSKHLALVDGAPRLERVSWAVLGRAFAGLN